MSRATACPLDCYDACSILYSDEKIKGKKEGHTRGFLCPHMNHYKSFETIKEPSYKGETISMELALATLKDILEETSKGELLAYRGSGNFGLMQEVTDHFFAQYGATLTNGSLCDGAGESGIIQGRGSNKNMPLSEIEKSDVVIIWGRNPHVTSSHLLPILKDKKIIVIDPIRTQIADEADIYLQIKPHSDIYLAMLIVRFLYINDSCDDRFIEEFASEFEEYYELTQTVRIKATLENMGITLGDIGDILELIDGKKVAIVCGIGVQKYRDGADVLRAIDAIAVALGLFGKEGCGVSYLGNSKEGIQSPFITKAKRVSKVNTAFEHFTTLFVQGANPLSQMPDTLRVKQSLQKLKSIIYFGLYENETSAIADLVIPAKGFLYKDDVRLSYSHNAFLQMHKQKESIYGISEYELAQYLCEAFSIRLEKETYYLEYFQSFAKQTVDDCYEVKGRDSIPYRDGFDTDDAAFLFLDELEMQRTTDNRFFLITAKSPKSLNSQFHRENSVYVHPSLGFVDGEIVSIESESGKIELQVKCSDGVRTDTLLIYSGTPSLNCLTSSKCSYEGNSAAYQENRVTISKI
jgi:anaerobic selenocysteine-containing dehydrogenase